MNRAQAVSKTDGASFEEALKKIRLAFPDTEGNNQADESQPDAPNAGSGCTDSEGDTRECTLLEQYMLRPSHVRLLKSDLAPMHDAGYITTESKTDKGAMMVCTATNCFQTTARSQQARDKRGGSALSADKQKHGTRDFTNAKNTVYSRQTRKVWRLYVLYPGSGEAYYLRMLLNSIPSPP